MTKQKYKIPLGKYKIAVVYTKDIFDQETLDKLAEILKNIDWDTRKWILLPSELVDRIEFVKVKKRKILAFAKWYLNRH